MDQTTITGGAHLARALQAEGITRVFGIPGTHNLEIFAQLSAAGIDIVSPRHEQGAGYMADGAARVTGEVRYRHDHRTGRAQRTHRPAAVLHRFRARPPHHPRHAVDPPRSRERTPSRSAQPVRGALGGTDRGHAGHESRRGVAGGRADAVGDAFRPDPPGRHRDPPRSHRGDRSGHAPSVLGPARGHRDHTAAGDCSLPASAHHRRGGAARAGAGEVPLWPDARGGIVLSSNAKGLVDDRAETTIGAVGVLELLPELTSDADAVIAIGTELAPSDFWPEPLPLPDTVVRIDIDEVQMLTNATVTHPILAAAKNATAALNEQVSALRTESATAAARNWTAGWKSRAASAMESDGRPWAGLSTALTAFAEADDSPLIVAADSTMACYYGVQTGWAARRGDRFLYPAGAGTLGYGLPAGIGAKLAAPQVRVVAIEGDGGSMFTIPELAAAVQAGVRMSLIVVDNGGYGEIRNEMEDRGDTPSGVKLTGPDFPALAQAMGARGIHVDGADALLAALSEAEAAVGPTLIHITEDSRAGADMLD